MESGGQPRLQQLVMSPLKNALCRCQFIDLSPACKSCLILFCPFIIPASNAVSISTFVVVAQLVGRSLPTPEVRGSIPVIGEILFIYSLSTVLEGQK